MRVGTPGFSGSRLREIREVRGHQQIHLAEMLDVSAQAISNYERGSSTPSPEMLARLVDKLNVSPGFFTLPDRALVDRRVYYRSLSAATKSARTRAEHRARWLSDITQSVSPFVGLPPVNIPDLSTPADPTLLDMAEIEGLAADTRAYWGMRDDPVPNMISLLENQGAIVARDSLGAATLDSLSEYDEASQRPLILIGTDKGTAVRWRFDAAHELGHLILHRHINRKRLANPAEHKLIENQAHRFAGALLLPEVPFADDLFGASLDAMIAIKPKWRTSVAMMIMRAGQLHLISESVEKRLWINYSRRGWRRHEPLDDSLEHEVPRLLRRSFDLIFEADQATAYEAVASTRLAATDVEQLAGLPPRYLATAGAPVVLRDRTDWPTNVTPLRPTT